MPSHGEQPQPTYYLEPLPPQPGQAPVPTCGQPVVPLPHNTVIYPPTAGIDGVVMVPGPNGQPLAYYTPPPAPSPAPLVSPLLVKAALVAFILGVAGIGVYFLATALTQLIHALILLGVVVVGGFLLIKMFSGTPSGSPINVSARGRAKVQIHTGRGHNRRGRRR
jgi:hypothetical protein